MKKDEKRFGTESEQHEGGSYLWDGTGEVDPLIASLEDDLSPARLKARDFAAAPEVASLGPVVVARRRILAAAAVLVVGLSLWTVLRPTESGWVVYRIAGSPQIGSSPLSAGMRIGTGDWITTDGSSGATFEQAGVGSVRVEGDSRIRVALVSKREQRLELAEGRISASISAPPRLFIVDTPAARAVDMGCSYTLDVDSEGAGILEVTYGRVDLEGKSGDVRVTAGVACEISPEDGPGTPYFLDASAAFVDAVRRFDSGSGEARESAASEVLELARARDSITVWHLALRQEGAQREAAVTRLLQLVPGIVVGGGRSGRTSDKTILGWWDDLGYGW